jgi:hypothetical protein
LPFISFCPASNYDPDLLQEVSVRLRFLIPLADALLASTFLMAQTLPPATRPADRPEPRAGAEKTSGILLDRVPARHLSKWQAIERLVFAEAATGQPLHPTLRNLYEWVEASGHAVYLELITDSRVSSCTAGNFSIKLFDPKGERHQAVIRLYLSNIDLAFIGESVARPDGLIPFKGLKKEERYAEVLGHELAHAVDILASLNKARKVEEMVEQTNELLLRQHSLRTGEKLSPDLQQRLTIRDSLLRELENRAEAIEATVWRELTASQPLRGTASDNTTAARR